MALQNGVHEPDRRIQGRLSSAEDLRHPGGRGEPIQHKQRNRVQRAQEAEPGTEHRAVTAGQDAARCAERSGDERQRSTIGAACGHHQPLPSPDACQSGERQHQEQGRPRNADAQRDSVERLPDARQVVCDPREADAEDKRVEQKGGHSVLPPAPDLEGHVQSFGVVAVGNAAARSAVARRRGRAPRGTDSSGARRRGGRTRRHGLRDPGAGRGRKSRSHRVPVGSRPDPRSLACSRRHTAVVEGIGSGPVSGRDRQDLESPSLAGH